MGTGGDFYAITDAQLQRLLDGGLPPSAFFQGDGGERPRECFSQFEHLWYELHQVLADENGCGANVSEAIPEMCGYSSSQEVRETATALERLDDAAIRERCANADLDAMCAELTQAVQALAAFYKRAAQNGDAVLFHVT